MKAFQNSVQVCCYDLWNSLPLCS